MKRIAQLLGLTTLLLAFIGCSPSAEKPADNNDGGGSTGANEKGVIAYSPLTLSNPFFKVIVDNIKAGDSITFLGPEFNASQMGRKESFAECIIIDTSKSS